MSTPLPPGQHEAVAFHRFGLPQFAQRFPKETSKRALEVLGTRELHLIDALEGLPRFEQVCDFHCVTTFSGLSFMDHLRARVALEERGRVLPGWLLRYLYRPFISGTVSRFSRASAAHDGETAP